MGVCTVTPLPFPSFRRAHVDVDKITDELREKMQWNQSLAAPADAMIGMGYEAEEPQMDWLN